MPVHEFAGGHDDTVAVVMPVDIGAGDPVDLLVADLVPFVSQIPLQGDALVRRVYELDHAPASFGLLVRQYPDVCADAGAEEDLGGQFYDAVDIVLLKQPPADVRRSRAGIAIEQGAAGKHDRGLASALLDGGELGGHVLDEQHAAVADGRQPSPETALEAKLGLLKHRLLLFLPFLAVGRIGQLIVERLTLEFVVREGVPVHDVLGQVTHGVELVLPRVADIAQQQIRLTHRPSHALRLLTVGDDRGRGLHVRPGLPFLQRVERVADEPAGSACAVVQASHAAVVGIEELVLVGEYEADGKPDHVAGRHEVLGPLRDFLAIPLDQMFVDVAHHAVGDGFRTQIEARETHAYLVQHALVLKILARLPDLELGQDVPRVRAEPVDVFHERVKGAVDSQIIEPEAGYVIEGLARESTVDLVLAPQCRLVLLHGLAHRVAGRLQSAFQSPQQREGKNELVVVGWADHITHVFGDAPNLTDVIKRASLLRHI